MKSIEPDDLVTIFEKLPGMCLILDTSFNIVAQNDAHEKATLTRRKDTVGRFLFEVFPDNPNHQNAVGLSAVRESLLTVLKTRAPHRIEAIKYDIARPLSQGGGFEERYWTITSTPVLGADGFVRWIINTADDITELVALRARANAGHSS